MQPRAQRSVAEGPGYHRGGESARMSSAECQTYEENVTSGMTADYGDMHLKAHRPSHIPIDLKCPKDLATLGIKSDMKHRKSRTRGKNIYHTQKKIIGI